MDRGNWILSSQNQSKLLMCAGIVPNKKITNKPFRQSLVRYWWIEGYQKGMEKTCPNRLCWRDVALVGIQLDCKPVISFAPFLVLIVGSELPGEDLPTIQVPRVLSTTIPDVWTSRDNAALHEMFGPL